MQAQIQLVTAGVGIDWLPILTFVGIWLVLVSVILFIFRFSKNRPASTPKEVDEPAVKAKLKKQDDKQKTGEIKAPTVHKQVETVVTEKTREEMFEMISAVKSLTKEMPRPNLDEVDMSDEEIKRLNESGVVEGLADTLMSKVQTDEIEGKRFSKMTLDASLFFDESDVDFFEKEFGATSEELKKK